MLKYLIATILAFFTSLANAGPCQDFFGSGTNCYGAVAVAPSNRENAQLGMVIGGSLGAALGGKHKAAVGVLGAGIGYGAGRYVDRQEEAAARAAYAEAQAIGYTECGYSAQKSGQDQNGSFNQTARSGKVVPGYKQSCN